MNAIDWSFDLMKQMRDLCRECNNPEEAVTLLRAGGDDRWGFIIENALRFGKHNEGENLFRTVGKMVLAEKRFDEIRKGGKTKGEQVSSASKDLWEAQVNCFNSMVQIDDRASLAI